MKQARAFFDSWLERFPTWADFVQAPLSGSLPEFGPSRETAIKQVTEWLGGAAEAVHNYANIVKYGIGEAILHRFTGARESTIEAALLALGPTAREKRMLEQMEAERKAAEAEARRQEAERRRRPGISADFRRFYTPHGYRQKLYKALTFWPESYTDCGPKYLYKRPGENQAAGRTHSC